MPEWEIVSDCELSITEKLKIEGGYLYRVVLYHNGNFNMSTCFVPNEISKLNT
jgi:hypothetical protein